MSPLARLLVLALLLFAATARAEVPRRIALVIGNGAYRAVPRLANPANDAKLMAKTLRDAGFTLVGGGPQIDLDKPGFDRAVQAFGTALQGAEVALFYYSGHGMQVAGENWLVPVDSNPATTRDLDFQMVDASLVLKQMEGAGTKLNILILDACRNNPFGGRGLRAAGGGLAEMKAPEGTLISYATQPGNVAGDGEGADSPYTSALAEVIRRPGLDVFQVFNQVGLSVKQRTGGEQQPWLASSPISGTFYFGGPTTVNIAPSDPDTVFWQSISESRDPAEFKAYLARFPNGTFADLARRRLEALAMAPQAAAPSKLAAASTRFDGIWVASLSCDARANAAGYSYDLAGQVVGGELHVDHGEKGQPRSLEISGTIAPDGSAVLLANGLTGNPKYSGLDEGSHFTYHLASKFDAAHGVGKRIEGRACSVVFTKQ